MTSCRVWFAGVHAPVSSVAGGRPPQVFEATAQRFRRVIARQPSDDLALASARTPQNIHRETYRRSGAHSIL